MNFSLAITNHYKSLKDKPNNKAITITFGDKENKLEKKLNNF